MIIISSHTLIMVWRADITYLWIIYLKFRQANPSRSNWVEWGFVEIDESYGASN